MAWVNFFARQIVEEAAAVSAATTYESKYPRFSEAYEALKWLLARKCDSIKSSTKIYNSVVYHLYTVSADAIAKTPSITALYFFDQYQLTIVEIKAKRAPDPVEDA
ncbi:MAG: hypothetical protein J0H82_19430 [Alphaproteobacteria bacterium]|jgi:hypothetical protein|nr:hypothetical protein [Alphaproteobacteria bacterium]